MDKLYDDLEYWETLYIAGKGGGDFANALTCVNVICLTMLQVNLGFSQDHDVRKAA